MSVSAYPISNHEALKPAPTFSEADSSWSGDSKLSSIVIASILFLTANTVAAAVQSRNDLSRVAFVVSIYAFLLLFFWCVHVFDRLPRDSPKREWLKVPIWSLATVLHVMFARRVTVIMSSTMAWLVWAMAGSSCLFTFYFFFIYHEKTTERNKAPEQKPLLFKGGVVPILNAT